MKPQDIERCNFKLYNKESTYLDNILCRQPKHLYISQSSFVSISYHMNFHKSEQKLKFSPYACGSKILHTGLSDLVAHIQKKTKAIMAEKKGMKR